MQISDFQKAANDFLEDLAEKIEDWDKQANLDTDLHDGILSITLEDGRQYVINKHEASMKIWVSSPVSGASYFVYDEKTGSWKDSNNQLDKMIMKELENL